MISPRAQRDFYEVLGVPRTAEEKAIKDAFRDLALKYHPGRNQAQGAQEKFKEVAEAYAVLSDPKKRDDYNAGGFAGVSGYSTADLFSGINLDEIFGGSGFGLNFNVGGPGGVFERFFGRSQPARGENSEVTLTLPLRKIATGGDAVVRLARTTPCPGCKGNGCAAGTQPRLCDSCLGSGKKTTSSQKGGVLFQHVIACPACAGRGTFIDHPCAQCQGRGVLEREEEILVKVPPGVEEGMDLRVPSRGLPGTVPDAVPGDLLVYLRSEPDPRFERQRADLWHTASIDVAAAALGTTLVVPTLEGETEVTVPAGTQPQAILRLRGRGLPHFRRSGHGDLYVRVNVRIPEKLTREQQVLFEQLQSLLQAPA